MPNYPTFIDKKEKLAYNVAYKAFFAETKKIKKRLDKVIKMCIVLTDKAINRKYLFQICFLSCEEERKNETQIEKICIAIGGYGGRFCYGSGIFARNIADI